MSEHLTNSQLKNRLLGAAMLITLAAIIVPMMLGEPKQQAQPVLSNTSGEFESRIQPLSEAQLGEEARAAVPKQASSQSIPSQLIQKIENAPLELTQKVSKPKSISKSQSSSTTQNELQSGWAVQAGIFSKPENANAIANLLRANGFQPQMSSTQNSIGEAIRVWIGPFASKAQARALSEKIEKQTGNGGYVSELPFKS